MMIRRAGNFFLGAGFLMLATAALIRDPTALDSNIGAGALTLVGIPAGGIGLVMVTGHVVYASWRESRPRRRRSASAGDPPL